MDKSTVDKYFTNQTTRKESREVLDWFETIEGEKYLEKRMNIDAGLMDRRELKEFTPNLKSVILYSSIHNKIKKCSARYPIRRTDLVGYSMKFTAAVLVVVLASVFSNTHENYTALKELSDQAPAIFKTLDNENRNLTLADGTRIRMNNNTEILVSANFLEGTREVNLKGEAYFDVEHNPDQPFIIHANRSTVEVLGTVFNIRSRSNQENVQVAVVEGKVALRSQQSKAGSEQLSVFLSKNQYGYLDLDNHSINVDDLAVENYLAWKNGRFKFENLTINQVCLQLNRIYNNHCKFTSSEIPSMMLTANFSNESLEKTLNVISMTLDISYELQSETVYWSL